MGFFESINRAFFNLTYNEKAEKAYEEQTEKAVTAVSGIKEQIDKYRETRSKIIADGESTDYFSTNSINRITEWENWLEKNGGLPAGDYTTKSTEMKTQWESLMNVNKTVKKLSRVGPLMDLYLKDNEFSIPNEQKKEILALKKEAETYYNKIVNKTPADIVAKLEEFNRKFEAIQKKIPENFEDLSTSSKKNTSVNIERDTEEQNYERYKSQVDNKDAAEDQNFNLKRLYFRTYDIFFGNVQYVLRYALTGILVVLIMNDAIARPFQYRIFYGVWMAIMCLFSFVPLFDYMALFYYIGRGFWSLNFKEWSTKGIQVDYVSAPVLFALFPLFETTTMMDNIPIFWYNPNRYNNLIDKKRQAYEDAAAKSIGKFVEEVEDAVEGLKSTETFSNAIDTLKKV